MPKKGENIYKRKDGRWEGRYIKERTTSKKVLYGYVYGRRYSEVKERLTVLKAQQVRIPAKFNPYYGTYGEWLDQWMFLNVRRRVKQTTYSNYSRLIKRHIIPAFGSCQMQEIHTERLQKFIYELTDQGLSPGTIRIIFTIVKQSMVYALKMHYLIVNPCLEVELPKLHHKKVQALSLTQQRELEILAFQDSECSPIILALYSGMRIGEISGLKWSDIDFEENVICVSRTLTRVIDEKNSETKTEVISGSPKTEGSRRIIPLADNLKQYLLEKRNHAVGEFVITSRKGFAEPRVINYRLKKTVKGTELSDIRFHSLRHTFATRCLEQGVDAASLSKLLGHRSTKLTLDTYADSIFEHRKEAMQAVDSLFIGEEISKAV